MRSACDAEAPAPEQPPGCARSAPSRKTYGDLIFLPSRGVLNPVAPGNISPSPQALPACNQQRGLADSVADIRACPGLKRVRAITDSMVPTSAPNICRSIALSRGTLSEKRALPRRSPPSAM